MKENDKERSRIIREFFEIYNLLRKRHNLRMHSYFDIQGKALIEIWEYTGEVRGKSICRIKEMGETSENDCYKKATEVLKSYKRKEEVERNEKRAG